MKYKKFYKNLILDISSEEERKVKRALNIFTQTNKNSKNKKNIFFKKST